MALPTAKEAEQAKKDELFLDFGDDPIDPSDEPEHAPTELHHTDKMPPGSGNYDWAEIRAGLIAHRLSKGRSADGSKVARMRVESDEAPITIISAANAIDAVDLPQSPRLIAERAVAAKWEIRAARSATHRAPVLYQADSKEGNAKEYQRGDVNVPAEDRTHYHVEGRLSDGARVIATFSLDYETRPDGDDKVKTAYTFGRLWDMYGKGDIARKATEFADWFDILVPKPDKKPKVDQTVAELEGTEWRG